ncbi:MAG: DUF5063 domain-containing protein [Tannerellaceae bacterium]|jgi:hypothetical protein|nr:DUF5063 domain-containing protein [Tannerellaceae bacterium]
MNKISNDISADNPLYNPQTIDFVRTALAYCSLVESVTTDDAAAFVDKTTKLLPMLYLKAALLPSIDSEEDEEYVELCITEDMYEAVRTRIAEALGESDAYLETFHPDMPLSDTPVAVFISEDLADVYQDAGTLCALFREGNEAVMRSAVALCKDNFEQYWGQKLLNSLRALHALRYATDEAETE